MFVDLTNRVFGDLRVLRRATTEEKLQNKKQSRSAFWLCLCVCGDTKLIPTGSLNSGNTSSCGCRQVEKRAHANTKHGMSAIKKNGGRRKPEYDMYVGAKRRAKKTGMDFNLDLDDIQIPDFCPVLGLPLFRGEKRIHAGSPSLDRIDNRKGYIKGNIAVISRRANCLKSDSSLEELEKICSWLRTHKDI